MIILTGASGGIGQYLIPFLSKIDNIIGVYNNNKPFQTKNSYIEYLQVDLRDSKAITAFVNNNKKKHSLIYLCLKKEEEQFDDKNNWRGGF